MGNESIIAALMRSLDESPEDDALRCHLAELLLGDGQPEAALQHCAQVIGRNPGDLAALRLGMRAADAVGDATRAGMYRQLLRVLAREDSKDGAGDDGENAPAPARVAASGKRPDLRLVGGAEPLVREPVAEPQVTLDDVAGLDAVKRRLELAFLGPIRNPGLAQAYGKRLRGGLMLYGPPGCGKTYIARALAGELGARFVSVGLNDVLDMWLGESEKRLHALFENARQSAPTVLFFDELDAIGRRRADISSSSTREVVNQLLTELDGVSTGEAAVFVLGATNLPWDVDTALKRPGRFDRSIFVMPPDESARRRIFELGFDGRPAAVLDLDKAARQAQGYSGADIAHACDTATESALARAMQSGRMEKIGNKDLAEALKEVRPSVGKWFQSAKNYAMFANSSGEFNDLAEYITVNRL